jgi:hypothetical protein
VYKLPYFSLEKKLGTKQFAKTPGSLEKRFNIILGRNAGSKGFEPPAYGLRVHRSA